MVLVDNNKNTTNDNGFGKNGCVYQLFKMFNNDNDFC